MNIAVYTTGYTKTGEGTSIGAFLECEKGVHRNVLALDECTKNQAELRAVEYALCAIVELSESHIQINVANPYVYGMLQRTQTQEGMVWNNEPKKNKETVKKIRTILDSVPGFSAELVKKNPTIEDLSKLTKASVSESA